MACTRPPCQPRVAAATATVKHVRRLESCPAVDYQFVAGERGIVCFLTGITQLAERAAKERPDSQIIVLSTTMIFAPAAIAQRDKIGARLIRANVFYSPLISDPSSPTMRLHKVPGKYPAPPLPVLDALARLGGQDSHTPQYLSELRYRQSRS
jgi:hypothetical protein